MRGAHRAFSLCLCRVKQSHRYEQRKIDKQKRWGLPRSLVLQ